MCKKIQNNITMKPLKQNKMNNNGIKTPSKVGGYRLGDHNLATTFCMTYKPKWIHRKMMSIFFGVKWVNETFKSE